MSRGRTTTSTPTLVCRLRLHAGPVAPGRNEDHVGLLRGRHVSHRVAHDAHAWPALRSQHRADPVYPVLDRLGNETGQSSPALDDLFTWNSFSPRLGVVLKLDKDGRTLLKGHYGRYYRGVITGEFDGVGPSVTGLYAFDGTYDENANPSNAELVLDNSQLAMDPKFKNPYTDQFIVGYEQEIFHNFGIQANFIYKRGEDYGGWRDIRGVYEPAVYVDDVGAEATGSSDRACSSCSATRGIGCSCSRTRARCSRGTKGCPFRVSNGCRTTGSSPRRSCSRSPRAA